MKAKSLTIQDLIDACNKLRDDLPSNEPRRFFTGGTGIPDQIAIDYWADTSIIVVTRDGKEYQYGKLLEDV